MEWPFFTIFSDFLSDSEGRKFGLLIFQQIDPPER